MDENNAGIYVFEGIDHVGKTTITKKLKEQITESTNFRCISIAFPGNEERTLGSLVYDIHHHQERYFSNKLNEASLQLLHIASHIDLIDRQIKELSKDDCIILLDRFWWSTYAYGLAGSLDKKTIRAIISTEKIYWDNLKIKKIFLIERENREHDYIDEKEKFIVNQYHDLIRNNSNSIIIENNGNLESTIAVIWSHIFGE